MADDAKHREVGFGQAIFLFFRNYANFRGRSSRGAFWWALLASMLAAVGAAIIDFGLIGVQSDDLITVGSALTLATLLPTLSLFVRRLHDVDRSGWRLPFWILPIVGIVMLIVYFGKAGTRGENRFGPDIEAGRQTTAY